MAYREGHAVADQAAERTDNGVREEHREDQRADRDNDQVEVVRHDALEARLDKAERQARQQGRDHLRLVADFGNRKQAEVPHLRHLLAEEIGVHQLRGNQGDAKNDPEDRRAAHLLHR